MQCMHALFAICNADLSHPDIWCIDVRFSVRKKWDF